MLTGDGSMLHDGGSASVSPKPRCSHGFADRRIFYTRSKGRWVSWILQPSRSAPVPLQASSGNFQAGLSSSSPSPLAPLPVSLSARPVHLRRLSPPFWHGPLPGVVEQCETCCLSDDARPHGRTRSFRRRDARVAPPTWWRHTLAHTTASSFSWRRTGASSPVRDTSPCTRRRWSR